MERVLGLVRRFRPLHVSIVVGEPLIRYRELTCLIRHFNTMGIEVQVVTSAVRRSPPSGRNSQSARRRLRRRPSARTRRRRTPATYDRILRDNIDRGHRITCSLRHGQRPQFLARVDYLRDFARAWSLQTNVRKIWFSLFTPQTGDRSPERLTAGDRATAIDRIAALPIPVSEGVCAGSGPRRLPSSARLAIGMHIRANHKLRLG